MERSPRIGSLPQSEWTPEVEAIFPILVPPGSGVSGADFNSVLMLAHLPELAGPFMRFNVAVGRGVSVPARLRELAILRVAWRRNCLYEWVHHLHGGAAAGLVAMHFDAIQRDEIGERFAPLEQSVLKAADEICAQGNLTDPTWSALAEHLDKKQILELVFVIGCFQLVSTLLNTTGVEVEKDFADMAVANGWPLLPA